MASTNELTLGYWAIRGKCGTARSLLAYCGLPFQQKLYSDYKEWFGKDKQGLGFEYPNLPYLIDGDKKITETTAILYYIALKAGKRELIGNTDDKYVQVQTAFGVIDDLRGALGKLTWTKGDFAAEKEEGFTKGAIKNKLDVLNKNLEGKEWICGFLSIADFYLYEAAELANEIQPVFDQYPNVANFHKRFGELPEIKAHRQSSDFLPIWTPPGMATWCNAK